MIIQGLELFYSLAVFAKFLDLLLPKLSKLKWQINFPLRIIYHTIQVDNIFTPLTI